MTKQSLSELKEKIEKYYKGLYYCTAVLSTLTNIKNKLNAVFLIAVSVFLNLKHYSS